MKKVIATGVLLLALVACSDPPDHGIITAKNHHGAYSWVQMVCAAYNKGICTVWVPITHHVAERWELCLRSGDGCRDVDQHPYDRVRIGDYYEFVEP